MNTPGRGWIALGAVLAGLGVTAGAFGAHGLEGRLSAEQLETFEVAVRYQMYHALALLLVGLFAQQTGERRGVSPTWLRSRTLAAAGAMFAVGIVLFSGCLYAWLFTGAKTFVLIVPVGGLAFIAGWLALAVSAFPSRL
jgi:uncharacterized membrane protein YgdD (TMEM256/DUF423 family)